MYSANPPSFTSNSELTSFIGQGYLALPARDESEEVEPTTLAVRRPGSLAPTLCRALELRRRERVHGVTRPARRVGVFLQRLDFPAAAGGQRNPSRFCRRASRTAPLSRAHFMKHLWSSSISWAAAWRSASRLSSKALNFGEPTTKETTFLAEMMVKTVVTQKPLCFSVPCSSGLILGSPPEHSE